jgi:hypothetical protein
VAPAARVPLGAPTATVERDSTTAAGRLIGIRIRAAPGTLSLGVRARDGRVIGARVDGRAIDPSRYRAPRPGWFLDYTAPSDSGFVLDLLVPTDSIPSLELVAQQAGLPVIAGFRPAPRPPRVLPSQMGDVIVVYRLVRLPR